MLRLRLDRASEPPAWFKKLPFAGEILIAGYVLAFAPFGIAVEFAMAGEWVFSATLALLGLILFPFIALSLHRQRLIHIGVSIFSVVGLLGAVVLFLWLAEEHAA